MTKKGVALTEEHRAAISKALKGRKFSDEHRAKIKRALEGRAPSPQTQAAAKEWWLANPSGTPGHGAAVAEGLRRTAAAGNPVGRPRGGRWKTRQGYVMIALPDGKRIMEHRLVMEHHLGRELRPSENVHHKNGIRDDNRLKNLELWTRSQPSGARVADMLAWAREIIDLYG